MTSSQGPPGPELPLPEEPVALGAETRAVVERSLAEGAALIDGGEWIAEPLWRCWGAALERAGMSRAQLVQIAIGYRRELWFWVMGERTWAQCASGLHGRVLRRLSLDAVQAGAATATPGSAASSAPPPPAAQRSTPPGRPAGAGGN